MNDDMWHAFWTKDAAYPCCVAAPTTGASVDLFSEPAEGVPHPACPDCVERLQNTIRMAHQPGPVWRHKKPKQRMTMQESYEIDHHLRCAWYMAFTKLPLRDARVIGEALLFLGFKCGAEKGSAVTEEILHFLR